MRSLFTAIALSTALLAQDKASPYSFVPKSPLFVMRMAGPGAWQSQFDTTQVKKLLLGSTAAPMLDQMQKGFDQALAAVKATGKVDAELVEKLLTTWSGELVLAADLDLDGLMEAAESGEPPPFHGVMVWTADGKNDFAPLLEATLKGMEGDGKGLRDLKVGDRTLRVAKLPNGEFTAPFLADGNLVWLFGSELDKQAPKLLAADGEHFEPATTASPTAMSVHIDSGKLFDKLFAMLAEQLDAQGAPFDTGKLMDELGLASLRTVDVQLGADGKYLALDIDLGMKAGGRGLFDVYPAGNKSRLLGYVPAGSEQYSTSPFDPNALWSTIAKVWDGLADAVPMSREDAMKDFAETFKVRLEEDLLAHLGKELLMVGDIDAAMKSAAKVDEADDPVSGAMAGLDGTVIAMHLTNGAAFGESLEKLLRARGLHAARKTEEYAGTKVHRLRLLGAFEVEYAVTDDLLVLGIGGGDTTQKNIRGILDERAARAAGKPVAELPAPIAQRLARLPEGWNGVSVMPMASMMTSMTKMMSTVAGRMGDGAAAERMQHFETVLTALAGEMRSLGLVHMVGTTTVDAKGWHMHARW